MATNIRADSTEYARVTLTVSHDITGDVIQVALPLTGVDPATWYTADVVGVVPGTGADVGKYVATFRVLVGPLAGVTTLTKGNTYDYISRVTDTPERPVRVHGQLLAT